MTLRLFYSFCFSEGFCFSSADLLVVLIPEYDLSDKWYYVFTAPLPPWHRTDSFKLHSLFFQCWYQKFSFVLLRSLHPWIEGITPQLSYGQNGPQGLALLLFFWKPPGPKRASSWNCCGQNQIDSFVQQLLIGDLQWVGFAQIVWPGSETNLPQPPMLEK